MIKDEIITFAIPYHTNKDYLILAVESVLKQNSEKWQLIILDNHSEEDASDYINNLKNPKVKYFRNSENVGMAQNWNLCIEKAETNKVCILHADDILEPDYLQQILEISNSYPQAAAWYCGAKIIDKNGKPKFSLADWYKKFTQPQYKDTLILTGEKALISLINGSHIFCPTICYNKSKFPKSGFNKEYKFVTDFDIITRILLNGETIVGKPHLKLYKYRRYNSNLTAQYSSDLIRFEEEIFIYNKIAKEAERLGYLELNKKANQKKIIKLNLAFQVLSNILKINIKQAVKLIRFSLAIK